MKAAITADVAAGIAKIADLRLEAAGLSATGGFDLVVLNAEPKISRNIALAKFNAKEILGRLGIDIPATADAKALTAVSLQGNLIATAKQAGLSNMKIALDETAITGTGRVADLYPPR